MVKRNTTVRNPTIVLRVPAPQTLVTQAQGQQGGVDVGQGYLTIEKELVKAGFTVRDRGLLVEILRSNQNLDYGAIQQKIDAQLILEIVSMHLGEVIEQVDGRTVRSPQDVISALHDAEDRPIALALSCGGKKISKTVPAP